MRMSVAAALMVSMVLGCAGTPDLMRPVDGGRPKAKAETATIVVVTPRASVRVIVDDKLRFLGQARQGYFAVEVPAGKHFFVSCPQARGVRGTVEAGKTYYLNVTLGKLTVIKHNTVEWTRLPQTLDEGPRFEPLQEEGQAHVEQNRTKLEVCVREARMFLEEGASEEEAQAMTIGKSDGE